MFFQKELEYFNKIDFKNLIFFKKFLMANEDISLLAEDFCKPAIDAFFENFNRKFYFVGICIKRITQTRAGTRAKINRKQFE